MLSLGEKAPEFTLPGISEGETHPEPYRLAEYTADGPVVLVFYPADFSPVCTTELCAFRDAEWLELTPGVDVLGVSRDTCYAHRTFIDQYNLQFALLSDVDGTVSHAYEAVYDEWNLHRGVTKRAVYVVDSDRTVQYAWEGEDAETAPDVADLLETAERLTGVDIETDAPES